MPADIPSPLPRRFQFILDVGWAPADPARHGELITYAAELAPTVRQDTPTTVADALRVVFMAGKMAVLRERWGAADVLQAVAFTGYTMSPVGGGE